MSSFYGFGIAGKIDDPFYAMQKTDLGLNAQSYAEYSTVYFGMTFIPCLLLGGPIINDWNRKNVLGWCTVLWGVCSVLHGFVTDMW
jgi:MFS family permease